MERSELIRRFVLNSICDDYENVDQRILQEVSRDAAKYGWTIARAEIVAALVWLVENGMAKAYTLSGVEPHAIEFQGMPRLDVIEENFKTYFHITKKGMDLHLSDDEP